jgi:hypothetical protein
MQQDNLSTAEQQAIRDIRDIQDKRLAVVETPPLEEQSHLAMHAMVDKLVDQWVAEFARTREQTVVLEQMVISQAAKVKNEITRMHLLGIQTMREAEHAHEVNQHIADELDSMMENEHG